VNTVIIVATAGTWEWKAPGLADIAGERLLDRTARQVQEMGQRAEIYQGEAQRAALEILATMRLWGEGRVTILRGDVIWPDNVLREILAGTASPQFYGNYCNVFGMGFAQRDRERVIEALERADLDARRHLGSGRGGWWQFYNAVAGFEDLITKQWNLDVFKTVPSVGTPSGAWTQRLCQVGDYYAFLEAHQWARSADNWPHNGRDKLDICVTGTGRCGTGYVSRLLSSVGLTCGHEAVFGLGGLHRARINLWNKPHLLADSSWLAAPFLNSAMLQNAVIVHLVRHPRLFIESAVGKGAFSSENLQGYSQFSIFHLPGLGAFSDDPTSAEAFRYVYWNAMIERGANGRRVFHRIEDDPRAPLRALGIHASPLFDDRTYNTGGPHKERLEWNNIADSIRPALRETMDRYEYDDW